MTRVENSIQQVPGVGVAGFKEKRMLVPNLETNTSKAKLPLDDQVLTEDSCVTVVMARHLLQCGQVKTRLLVKPLYAAVCEQLMFKRSSTSYSFQVYPHS